MNKEEYMKIALKEAEKAYKELEVPVGAIIVKDNNRIMKRFSLKAVKSHVQI